MKKIIFFIFLAILLAGCSKGIIYSHYEDIPLYGWESDSSLNFTFQVTDTLKPYDMVLNLRHTERYPYQNIWFFTEFYRLDSVHGDQLILADTLEFYLADQRGRWMGNGFGSLKDMPMLVMQQFVYPTPGNYRLNVRQGMREEALRGVNEVGLTIIDSEKN